MKSPLHRIRQGALFLLVVFVLAVLGYRFVGGYDWLGAVWMVVVTISSVGYSERSQAAPEIQVLTIAVILLGMSAAAYTLGGFIQFVLEGEFERYIGRRRMNQEIENLKEHVIICGFGRVGESLAHELRLVKQPLVVIDNDQSRIEEATGERHFHIRGDATEEETLQLAGVERARTLFTGLPSDADNVFITLTARNLNPDIQIVASAQQQTTAKKLRQAGADRVVMPMLIGSQHVQRIITRPSTADLMELMAESSFQELELDEITIEPDGGLIGVTVEKTEAHRRHRLLVVAVRQKDGSLVFNPDAAYTFQETDTIMVMGHREDIDGFRRHYQL